MKIIFIKISELKPAEYNPRQASKKEIEDIRRSLEMFGFIDPNIVNMHPDREKVIVGGHLRTQVWGEMGNDLVPCVTVSLPLEKEKELNIRLNKNSGSWDWDKLANEFEIEDLIEWGFTDSELDFDLSDFSDNSTETSKVRDKVEVSFQLGELRFRISEGDYLKWIDGVVSDSGFSDEEKVQCVKNRLRLN